MCTRNNGDTNRQSLAYPIEKMSDGERQVFGLLIDLETLKLANPGAVLLVDEPELHLHPALANRQWTALEQLLPNAFFVYTTHSIAFAMRQSVDTVVVLSRERPATVLGGLGDLPTHELKEFLGAIPGILSAPAALIVEGTDTSFDSPFYSWLLAGENVAVVGVEGCENVFAATQRSGVWKRLAGAVTVHGVVDRDYRTDTFVASAENGACSVLDYHEAESYLSHPQLVSDLGNAIGAEKPTVDEIRDIIRDHLSASAHAVAIQRTFQRSIKRLAVSIDRKETRSLIEAGDDAAIRNRVEQEAEKELTKSNDLSPSIVGDVFSKELQNCRDAAGSGDANKMLKLVESKHLLRLLAQRIGLKDSGAMLRSAIANLDIGTYPHLAALRAKLRNGLGLAKDRLTAS